MDQKQTNGKAVASLVLGIVSCACVFLNSFTFIGIIIGIVGLVLGISARKEEPSGMATAGIVLSVIAIAFCAVIFVSCVACIGCLVTSAAIS